jgi:hypothetical protein
VVPHDRGRRDVEAILLRRRTYVVVTGPSGDLAVGFLAAEGSFTTGPQAADAAAAPAAFGSGRRPDRVTRTRGEVGCAGRCGASGSAGHLATKLAAPPIVPDCKANPGKIVGGPAMRRHVVCGRSERRSASSGVPPACSAARATVEESIR